MNPDQALEIAAYNYLTNLETELELIASSSIYKGLDTPIEADSDENTTTPRNRVHPSVTVEAEGAHAETVLFTGTWEGVLAVTVEADSENTTDATFNTICSEVFSKFNIVELEANFSSRTANFFMYQMHSPSLSDAVNNGTNWQKTLRLTCVYAQADL